MTIGNFVVNDLEIVRYFSEVPEDQRPYMLERALKLGVIALQSVDLAERVDYVHKCFDNLGNDFSNKIDGAFGEDGQFHKLIDNYLGERGILAEEMEETFGKNGQFSMLLKEHFGQDGEIIKKLFNPLNPDTPLGALKRSFEEQLIQLRQDLNLDAQRKDMAQHTTIKGKEFEDEFEEMICSLARPFGDIVERTGTKPGIITKSKKGDFVVTLSNRADLNVVFEAKDKGKVSIREIEREMDEALENRAACYGVFVSRTFDSLPGECGWFNEYNGRYIVICMSDGEEYPLQKEILQIGYRWARLRALSLKQKDKCVLDIAAIDRSLEATKQSLSSFSKMRGSCTSGHKAIDAIEKDIDQMEKNLQAQLKMIEIELNKATSSSDV